MRLGLRTLGAASLRLGRNPAFPEGAIELSHVSTKPWHAGKGIATRLLNTIAAEADRERKVLVLMPDSERLAKWYARQGFHYIQDDPAIMARPINGTA